MADEIFSKLIHIRDWISGHKAVSAVILALIMGGGAVSGVLAWEGHSHVIISGLPATDTFTTSVSGVATNASQTLLTIGGSSTSYNETNIASYQKSTSQSGPGNSSLGISIGNILPGDWVEFSVTITNTGTSTLYFGNYTLNDAAYNSTTDVYIPPSENVTGTMNGTNSSTFTPIAPYTFEANFGNLVGFTSQDFASQLAGHTYWDFVWGANSAVIPSELKSGASFTYSMYVGLGTIAPYPPTEAVFDMAIPLIPAR